MVSANGTRIVNLKKDTLTHQSLLDYGQREVSLHSHILHRFPGTYLDSMGIVIHLLSDSIRKDLLKTKLNDSMAYLKTYLNNILKDSLLLERLGKLSTEEIVTVPDSKGLLMAHCMDASNSHPVDSVAMDVFLGNSLITSGVSDNLGVIRLHDIPGGIYSIVFSRRGYIPVSIIYAMGNHSEQPSLEMPLKKQSSYIVQLASKNIWLSFTLGILILLIIMGTLAYCLAKFIVKRQNRKTE